MKLLLLKVSLMNFIPRICQDQMERESGATRGIIDELHSWDIQGDQMEVEHGLTRSIVAELHS